MAVHLNKTYSLQKFLVLLLLSFSMHSALFGQIPPSYDTVRVCSGAAVQIGIDPVPGNTYTWPPFDVLSSHVISNPILTPFNDSPQELTFTYPLREYSPSGVLLRLIVYVAIVQPRLYASVTILEANICEDDSAFVNPFIYGIRPYEIFPQTYITFLPNDSIYALWPNDSTLYSFSYLDSNTCIQRSLNAEVYMHERPVVDLSSDETLFCRSDTLSYPLNFFPPSGGLFYGQGLDQDGIFHPIQSNSGEVDLAYTVSNNGCATTDSLIIYVYGEGDVTLSNLPNFCQSAEPIELDIAIPAGGVYTIDGIETQLLNPALLSPGSHELAYQVVFGQSCNISVANVFNVIQRPATPSIQVEPDSVVCAGDTITLQSSPFTKYVWSNGDTTRTTLAFESGVFSVQTKSSLGCLSLPASISVIVTDSLLGDLSSPLYPSGFPISVFGLRDGSIELSLSGGAAPFEILWSTGEDSVYVIDSLGIGTYYVSVSDRAGCFFSDTISLEQPDEVIIIVPNVFSLPNGFTPNGDGFNDAYKINGLLPEHAINQFRVWDIKRRLVFEAKNYDNTWTGLDLNGNKLPAGTYFATFESEGLDKVERFFIDLRYE